MWRPRPAGGSVTVGPWDGRLHRRGFATPERLGIGPDDARRARLVAGTVVAKLDAKTRAAFGISQSAKDLERKLTGASAGAFLIARDSNEPGFAARRGAAGAVRRELGAGLGLTLSGEQGNVDRRIKIDNQVEDYRLASVGVDHGVGRRGWVSLGATRLDERRTLLGGRISDTLGGGGGSTTTFVDGEYRHDFGSGVGATIAARRGWTTFGGGKFSTAAYSLDLAKSGLFNGGDRLGLRLSQPLRVEHGGFAMLLPTSYDYATGSAGESVSRYSLTPSGREIDAEFGYSTTIGRGWMGANLFARRQPGHIAREPTDLGAAMRYSLEF